MNGDRLICDSNARLRREECTEPLLTARTLHIPLIFRKSVFSVLSLFFHTLDEPETYFRVKDDVFLIVENLNDLRRVTMQIYFIGDRAPFVPFFFLLTSQADPI